HIVARVPAEQMIEQPASRKGPKTLDRLEAIERLADAGVPAPVLGLLEGKFGQPADIVVEENPAVGADLPDAAAPIERDDAALLKLGLVVQDVVGRHAFPPHAPSPTRPRPRRGQRRELGRAWNPASST